MDWFSRDKYLRITTDSPNIICAKKTKKKIKCYPIFIVLPSTTGT